MTAPVRLVVDVASGEERYVPFTADELAQRRCDRGPQRPAPAGSHEDRERLRDALALAEELVPGWGDRGALEALPRRKRGPGPP